MCTMDIKTSSNILYIIYEHQEIHRRTSHVYHMNITKINYRTSYVHDMNITKIHHITSHVNYVNITNKS
jgi:hypothetical protein